MHYFVAAYEHVDKEAESFCELGEVVMPDFRPGSHNFLSLETESTSPSAMVVDCDFDPDQLFAGLVKRYPGIPENLLNVWFVSTVLLAGKLPDSAIVYTADTGETYATVLDLTNKKSHKVWSDIDTTDYN